MLHRFLNDNCKLEFVQKPDYDRLRYYIKNLFEGVKEYELLRKADAEKLKKE